MNGFQSDMPRESGLSGQFRNKKFTHQMMEMNTLGRGFFTVSVAPTSNSKHRENKSSRQYRRGASCRMIKPKSCRALVTVPLQPICLAPRALQSWFRLCEFQVRGESNRIQGGGGLESLKACTQIHLLLVGLDVGNIHPNNLNLRDLEWLEYISLQDFSGKQATEVFPETESDKVISWVWH